MKTFRIARGLLVVLMSGSVLFGGGCTGIVRDSVKEGVFAFLTGSVQSNIDTAAFSDFLLNVVTGGFTGGQTDGGTA